MDSRSAANPQTVPAAIRNDLKGKSSYDLRNFAIFLGLPVATSSPY